METGETILVRLGSGQEQVAAEVLQVTFENFGYEARALVRVKEGPDTDREVMVDGSGELV